MTTSKLLGRSTASTGAIEEIAVGSGLSLSAGTLTVSVSQTPSKSQTVLSGPVDSSGYAAFGGSTGSTTVTASGTIKATAAAGGDDNYTGSITNPSWTGISTNGTMYLYLDITSVGVVTTGSTTLLPIYQWGGTYSTTNLQNTFNVQEMMMKVGNGSTASQVFRVFVGEVTVAGAVVTAITWYALMSRWIGAYTNTFPSAGTAISQNHNIGYVYGVSTGFEVECITTDLGYAVGDVLTMFSGGSSGVGFGAYTTWKTSKTMGTTVHTAQPLLVNHKITGAPTAATLANWKYRFTASRGW